ncbi:MAG: TlpA disulfide reductase family protein [Myxococcota bacterium]|nr:TlpA disulfide reductase family protein [Myxococcota bacterium]
MNLFPSPVGPVLVALSLLVLVGCTDSKQEQSPEAAAGEGDSSANPSAPAAVEPAATPRSEGSQASAERLRANSPEVLAQEKPLPQIARLPSPKGIPDSPRGLRNGDYAPELAHLDMRSGKGFLLSEWTGPEAIRDSKVVIVGFTASWCGPCKQSYPFLQRMQEEFGADLKVVLLTTDPSQDAKAKHLKIVESSGLQAPLLDPDPHTLRAWLGQRRNVPHFYVINRAGEVLVQDRGFGKKVRKSMPGQIRYALRHPEYVVRR